jgi:hypothetical protein
VPLSTTVFRLAIALALVGYILDRLLPEMGLVHFDPDVEAALSWNYFGSLIPYSVQWVWFVVWSVATAVGLIGLAFFWRPARWILAGTLLLSLIIQPLLGLVVYSPFQAFFAAVAGMLTLWLTTVSFWSPLASRFSN